MAQITDPRIESANEDTLLCREVLLGNEAAFTRLAQKYRKKLYWLGFGFFRNADDTEDFIQDVLIKMYVSLSTFRGDSRFSTWMMRIAYNTAINSIKRRKEYVSLAEDFDVVDNSANPEEDHLKTCSLEALSQALRDLPEKHRVCIDMFFLYEMPYADISEVIGLPINTIKSHVFRAKKILRKHLDEGDLL